MPFRPALAWAQQANVNLDHNPQKNTENLVPFSAPLNSPDVRDDRTVVFRVKAPAAKEVRLAGVALLTALGKAGQPVPFTKGDDGIWTLTVGPLKPDMYAYHINIDGVTTADPNNTYAAFTAMPPHSQLIVHGDGPAYYDARNVPHGNVTRHVPSPEVTKGERELYVYTARLRPQQDLPGALSVGGSGEPPANWIYDGRANFIMDNLLAEGKAVPMVIAIPNNQVVHRNHPQHAQLTFKIFEDELRKAVIPLVEREYAVRRDPKGRALRPLDGRHTIFAGFNSPRPFANFGCSALATPNPKSPRHLPQRPRREQEGRLPLRRSGHAGRSAALQRPRRRTGRRAPGPRRQPQVPMPAARGPRLGDVAHLSITASCRTSGGRT